jgi:hypothetical protein
MSNIESVFQVQVGGNGNLVAPTFEKAMQHVAFLAVRNDAERKRLGQTDVFPGLTTTELSGSLHQHIRFHCQAADFESMCIIEHAMGNSPGTFTDVFYLDLVNDFDPAFELQRALYLASEGDEPLQDIANNLEEIIREGLDFARDRNVDELAISRIRKIERLMGGTKVIPEDGTTTDILDRLPETIVSRFHELAAKAFPDETPAPPLAP